MKCMNGWMYTELIHALLIEGYLHPLEYQSRISLIAPRLCVGLLFSLLPLCRVSEGDTKESIVYSECTVDMIDRVRVTREGKECM